MGTRIASVDNGIAASLPEATRMAKTARRMLADINDLAPEIASRAMEIEAARRVPPDLVETLKSIGIFRMFKPRSHGGLEFDLPAGLEIIAALSRVEGSVGWTAAIGSGSDVFTALLPRTTYERIYRKGPDVVIAGSTIPAGTAEPAGGGWRVRGRWPFASGCQHADWMFGFCIVTEGGKPLADEGGKPRIRAFFLPAGDWEIEDTWYVGGLKGTGSHHITIRDAIVPAENFFDFPYGAACLPGPLYQALPQILPLVHGGICVGIAEGAVDDLVELANTGRKQMRAAVPMRESECFRSALGQAEAEARAAHAFLQAQATSHWRHALAGTLRDEALATESTQAAIWIATTCVHCADACFALGGGGAVYESSPLQRRLRDLHVAAQHAAAAPRYYVDAGKQLLDGALMGAKTAGH